MRFRFALFCTISLSHLILSVGSFAAYTDSEVRGVETEAEAKIREIRSQEIAQLRLTLGRHFPVNRRAELYFRLAEIYMEAYHSDYILEGRVHDQKLQGGVTESLIDHAHSRAHLLNGIKACKEVLVFNIPFDKLDHIYYFLGFNYGELGDREQSVKYYEALVSRFPKSPFSQEGFRELGDAAFSSGQFRRAIDYYDRGIRSATHPRSSEYELPGTLPRMRHRMAWSHYRLREFDQAIQQMKAAIEDTRKSGERFLSLRDEALRDIALFMTETGKVEEAIRYFQVVAGNDEAYPAILDKLGTQYERNVEPLKAIQVYESLLKTHTNTEVSFRVLVKLVDLDLRRAQYASALSRLNGLKIPEGVSIREHSESELRTALQNLRAMIRRTATENHEKYRKKADKTALIIAENYYTSYLTFFLSKEDPRQEIPEIQMYLADTKRELGKPEDASRIYRKVVESRDHRYAKEAGLLWTASLSEAIKKTTTSQKEPSELEKEFVSASDSLAENLSETSEGREAALHAAQLLGGYDSTKREALDRISKLIQKWPKSLQAVIAARLKIQLLSQSGPEALSELRDTLGEYRANAVLMQTDQDVGKGALKGLLSEQESRLQVLSISQNEREKNYAAAARGYEDFARDSTQVDLAEKAYTSAIANYLKAEDAESIERVSATWQKRFPKSSKAPSALRDAATHLLISGSFDASARIFEMIGQGSEDAEALETAARIYEANQSVSSAERSWIKFMNQFKTSLHRGTVAKALAGIYEQSGREGEAAQMYRICMGGSAELRATCGVKLAELYLRLKNFAESKKVFKQVAETSGKGPFPPDVGYARFQLASQMEVEAKFLPLRLPEDQLKKALDARLQFLVPLSKAYFLVVDAGGPWAVAALDRLAQWAWKFADEVDQIQPPVEASPAGVEGFKKSLSAMSVPLRKKAIDTWSESYSKSVQAEIYSPVVPEISDRIAELKDHATGRAQGFWKKMQISGVPADGGTEGSLEAMRRVRDKLLKNPKDDASWVDYGNLLWGEGRPLMAQIAYDRAILLNSKNPTGMNNRGVLLLSNALKMGNREDPRIAAQAAFLFQEALKNDEFFLPSKMNLALLQNYYRLFKKSKNLWEQTLAKTQVFFAYDGLAIAQQGLGELGQAEANFDHATGEGASAQRFALLYHEAARLSRQGKEGAAQCLARLSEIDTSILAPFELGAIERLKRTCES